jgi:uncharacterized YccA/Bax inhibitor family protein
LESVFFVIVGAALNLFLDFDEQGSEQKMQNTWNEGVVTDRLIVTLVWLYINF